MITRAVFLFIIFLFIFDKAFCDTKTGCLVQGDTKLYTNSIGPRDPYWAANPSPTTPAYNGTPTDVDNRSYSDVICLSYFIKSKDTNSPCFQYTNGSPPTFVSSGGNGVIAVIEQKCPPTPVPLDDYIPFLILAVGAFGYLYIENKKKPLLFKY
ncbi:MAG: hypothetical protein EOO91_10360 [Pedobacter sp.]|nr:MAG: hypothetical protein EOO91_10360 [Pedobacter sp.]